MIKHGLIERIRTHIQGEIDVLVTAVLSAHDAATNEESKAENKYDTRALEASYLAGAQARRTTELQDMLMRYQRLAVRDFDDHDAIALTALVGLECDGVHAWYFLGPCAGGIKVVHHGHTVVVITPAAPLGRQLIGREVGDSVSIRSPAGVRKYEILELL